MVLHLDAMLLQKSFSIEAVLTISKPMSPPKVEGFHQWGLQMGLAMRPLTLQGPPTLTIVRGVREGLSFSANKPELRDEKADGDWVLKIK